MAKKQKLSQSDWIKAAFHALHKGGPQAIKAEPIARQLRVSKGSFYWHFKDVADLKAQMLAHWKDAATTGVIVVVDATVGGPQMQLTQLVELATDGRADAYGGANAEAAIRDWARYDPGARAVVGEVDSQRLDYLAGLFGRVEESTSRANAAVLYSGLIGLEGLTYTGKTQLRADLHHLLRQLLK